MQLADKFRVYTLSYNCLTVVHIVHATRSEEGIYYAVDIGGTGFRFLKVQLGPGSTIINQKIERQPVKKELMEGTSEVCFYILFLLPY